MVLLPMSTRPVFDWYKRKCDIDLVNSVLKIVSTGKTTKPVSKDKNQNRFSQTNPLFCSVIFDPYE